MNNDFNVMNLCVRSEIKEVIKVDLSIKGKIDFWLFQVYNLFIFDVYYVVFVIDYIFKEYGNIF